MVMGEIVAAHEGRTEFPQIQWPTLRPKGTGLWYTSLGFPKGIDCIRANPGAVCSLVNVQPCSPFNQRATFSPPLAIATTAMVRSTMLAPTVTHGLHQPTATTTVVI